MTKRERAQVVELLRCAADGGTLSPWPPIPNTIEWLAWEAKRAINADESLTYNQRWGGRTYQWRLLEAAQRVEEGTWP